MVYVLALVAVLVLWVVAFVAQRRVAVARVWLRYDVIIGVVFGVVVGVKEGASRGLLAGAVVVPLLILFSAMRTIQMRYIERKTQTILDSSPGMREAYEREATPSRRERKAGNDGVE